MKELSAINHLIWRYKYHLLLGIVFVTISNFFAILPAQVIRQAIDMISENYNLAEMFRGTKGYDNVVSDFLVNVGIFGGLIILLSFLRGFFLFLVRQTIIVMSRRVEYDQKNEIYNHYQSLPLSFYRRNSTGDLMARISEDVSKVRMYTGPAIMYGINLVVLFAMAIGYMVSVNAYLTFLVLLPLPLLSISIYFVNNIINKRSEAIQAKLSDISTFVQEAFSGIRVLKSFSKEKENHKRFNEESNEYHALSMRLTNVNSLFLPIIVSLVGLSTILTIYVGGIEVLKGDFTLGNIAEFVIYINMLTWPVTSLGWITSLTQRAAASQRRINEFLSIKSELVDGTENAHGLNGKIHFENVSFTYEDSGIEALKEVSFEVEGGENIAIIGPTGSGKSTLANLIARLYDPQSGRVCIDGKNVKDYTSSSIRSFMGYVPQDVFLFSDSIKNNIAFGLDEVDQYQIEQVIELADLRTTINNMENGLETRVGERGVTLSGGQKQRVSIARALVRNPQILVLDDSLSAVDTQTENNILNNLKGVVGRCTTIIVSHRVSSAKLADKILVIEDGRITQSGTHEELLEQEGYYKSTFERQTADATSKGEVV